MTIVLTGGGSGGHITPVLAVASELKKLQPTIELVYIDQRGDSLGDLPAKDPNIDQVFYVRAGKFRRYHGEGFKQILDLKTGLLNIRDVFFVFIGIFQSWRLVRKLKPELVFSRGGFVSVPVCLGAKLNRVPYITHDSDPVPSLANRLIAPWALEHFVALPKEIYKYSQDKTITTGIPLSKLFVPVDKQRQADYRKALGIDQKSRLLFIIGGGLGARSLNQACIEVMPHLLEEFQDLVIVHIVGRGNEEMSRLQLSEQLNEQQQSRVKIIDYSTEVYRYSGAADLIITRAGATNLAEFAVQGKAIIVVPSSFLTAGHQLKNAQFLAENHAAVVIADLELERDSNRLAQAVSRLLKDPKELIKLGASLEKFAQPNATGLIAKRLLKLIKIEA